MSTKCGRLALRAIEVRLGRVVFGLGHGVFLKQTLVASKLIIGQLEVGLGAAEIVARLADFLFAVTELHPLRPRLRGRQGCLGRGDFFHPSAVLGLQKVGLGRAQFGSPLRPLGLQLGDVKGD